MGGCQTRKPGGGRASPQAMVGLSFKMLQECKVSFRRNKTRTNTQSRAGTLTKTEAGAGAEAGETGRRPTNVRPTPNLHDVYVCVCVVLILVCLLGCQCVASLATQPAYAASINYCCCLSCTEILVSV